MFFISLLLKKRIGIVFVYLVEGTNSFEFYYFNNICTKNIANTEFMEGDHIFIYWFITQLSAEKANFEIIKKKKKYWNVTQVQLPN